MSSLTALKFLDATEEGLKATANTLNAYSNLIDMEAESEMFKMRTQMDNEINQIMNDFNQRNDYTNWNTEIDDYFQQKQAQLQEESKYGITARNADRLVTDTRNRVTQQVTQLAMDKQKNSLAFQNEQTIQMMKDTYSPQEALYSIGSLKASEFASNIIDEPQYRAYMIATAEELYANDLFNKGASLIESAIENGQGIDTITSQVNADDTDLKLSLLNKGSANREALKDGTAQYEEAGQYIDKDRVKADVNKRLETLYKSQVVELQGKNAEKLSQYYGSIWDDGNTIQDRINMCDLGIDMINKEMTGLKLSEADRVKYIDKLKHTKEEFEKNLEIVIKGGNSSETAEKFSLQTELKNSPDTYLAKVKNGEMNLYEARDILQSEIYNLFIGGNWRETEGMTQTQKEEFYQKNYSQFANNEILNNKEILEILQNEPRYADLNNKYNATIKDIEKNPDKYGENTASYLAGFIIDLVASDKNTPQEELIKRLDTQINAITLSGMNSAYMDKGILGVNKDFTDDPKSIGRATISLANNDFVYTDVSGRETWLPGAKEKAEKIAKQQGLEIVEYLNKDPKNQIKPSDLQMRWTYTKDDMTPIPVFTDGKNEYTIEASTTRDGKKNIVTGYKILKDGKEVETISKKGKKAKEATKQSLDYEFNKEREELMQIANMDTIPGYLTQYGYTQEAWENNGVEWRKSILDWAEKEKNKERK